MFRKSFLSIVCRYLVYIQHFSLQLRSEAAQHRFSTQNCFENVKKIVAKYPKQSYFVSKTTFLKKKSTIYFSTQNFPKQVSVPSFFEFKKLSETFVFILKTFCYVLHFENSFFSTTSSSTHFPLLIRFPSLEASIYHTASATFQM